MGVHNVLVTWLMLFFVSKCMAYDVDLEQYEYSTCTLNTALREATSYTKIAFLNSHEKRLTALIAELFEVDCDVICLQEVWFYRDVRRIINDLAGKFPYSFSYLHDENGLLPVHTQPQGPPCSKGAVDLKYCLAQWCTTYGVGKFHNYLQCMLDNCYYQYSNFIYNEPNECLSCLMATLPNLNFFKDLCTSFGDDADNAQMNTPGLLILSTRPLTHRKYVEFYPGYQQATERGYLKAKFDHKFTVVCSQLSTTSFPYGCEGVLAYPHGYNDQNNVESLVLIDTFKDAWDTVICVDSNSGYAVVPYVESRNEDNYGKLALYFRTLAVDRCTVCRYPINTYYSGDDGRYVLDHIFCTNDITVIKSERILLDKVTFGTDPTEYSLSDHFGVRTKFLPCGKREIKSTGSPNDNGNDNDTTR